jgi:DNA adenine methylase
VLPLRRLAEGWGASTPRTADLHSARPDSAAIRAVPATGAPARAVCPEGLNNVQTISPTSPPAPRQGGKRHLAQRLVARIDAIPHDLYAEPFIGMGGVFFRRRRRPRVEVINDLSRDVATFFRVLQRHPQAFLAEALRFRISCRDEFDRLLRVDPETLTDLERAARFYYLQRLSYAGKVSSRTFGVSGDQPSRFNPSVLGRRLEQIHARLSSVLIECLPWREFLDRYDRAKALFYLDPPYFGCENDYGKGLFGRSDFGRMAERLASIKGRFLLSLNDTPAVREIFSAFTIEDVETRYFIGDADRGTAVKEVIISDGPRPGDGGPQRQLL